jgi:hypothetical protein
MAAARKIPLSLRDFRLPPRSSWELRSYGLLCGGGDGGGGEWWWWSLVICAAAVVG